VRQLPRDVYGVQSLTLVSHQLLGVSAAHGVERPLPGR